MVNLNKIKLVIIWPRVADKVGQNTTQNMIHYAVKNAHKTIDIVVYMTNTMFVGNMNHNAFNNCMVDHEEMQKSSHM